MNSWSCILCGASHDDTPEPVSREGAVCGVCDSTWRTRAVTLAVMTGLGIDPAPLSEISTDWSRVGVGFDDHPSIFSRFPARWDFVNTRLHRFPQLDLLSPTDTTVGAFEFALCSDVLEHVQPPYRRGLEGLLTILKPGGFAVISVPVSGNPETIEHYPGLKRFEILESRAVEWTDEMGTRHHQSHPVFHGGDGLTLEFRIFSASEIVATLVEVGFESVLELFPRPDLGVFQIASPGVFVARKPATNAA